LKSWKILNLDLILVYSVYQLASKYNNLSSAA
jgi:hypothetical protein